MLVVELMEGPYEGLPGPLESLAAARGGASRPAEEPPPLLPANTRDPQQYPAFGVDVKQLQHVYHVAIRP